jgi:hypothetical protein
VRSYLGVKLSIASPTCRVPAFPPVDDPELEVWKDHQGEVCAFILTLNGRHWIKFPGLAVYCFGGGNDPAEVIPEPGVGWELVLDIFQRLVLPVVLQVRGMEVLHASAVLTSHGVVAVCGVSGAGKSTIASALSRRGYSVWADDAVAFELCGPKVTAIPLPFSLRLLPDALALLGREPGEEANSVSSIPGSQEEISPAPLAAIVEVGRRPARGAKVAKGERLLPAPAFPALLAHAYFFTLKDEARKRRMIENYLELAARVPCFRIRYAPGLENLPLILDYIEAAVDGLKL